MPSNCERAKTEATMSHTIRFASLVVLVMLAACDMQTKMPPTALRPVMFNPPATILAASPSMPIVLYHVAFETGSKRLDSQGTENCRRNLGEYRCPPNVTSRRANS